MLDERFKRTEIGVRRIEINNGYDKMRSIKLYLSTCEENWGKSVMKHDDE
jgi:uncharacterized protein YprB with RNaseH-like and TPR domain